MQNFSFYIRPTHINIISNNLFPVAIDKSFGDYFVIDIFLLLKERCLVGKNNSKIIITWLLLPAGVDITSLIRKF
jgi:hypothetical protein